MIKAVAATGALGTGFKAETLARAAEGADFIGCDAGSSDPGPYYLGSGQMLASVAALSRDLELMIAAGLQHRIPVLVGSAGTAGARPQLERTVEIVRQLAAKNEWHFKLAVIDSEIAPETVAEAFKAGQLIPLGGAPDVDEASIMAAAHIVAMQGPDCFIDALGQGADVIIAGRTSDTAIYAAIPIMRGIPKGIAFHAAKILECGAASTVERKYPDSMVGYVDHDGFTVDPPNPDMYCTPQSVEAFKVDAVDTTAAGDCFNAAFAFALTRGKTPAEAARYGAAASAISVTRAGAQPSLPTAAEVEAFLNK